MPAIALILVCLNICAIRMLVMLCPEAQGPFVAFPKTLTSVAAGLNPEAEWTDTTEDDAANDPFKDNPYVN